VRRVWRGREGEGELEGAERWLGEVGWRGGGRVWGERWGGERCKGRGGGCERGVGGGGVEGVEGGKGWRGVGDEWMVWWAGGGR